MTRINCIPVEELRPKHLVAEYRELPRVFGLAKKYYDRHGAAIPKGAPDKYTLGAGHVKFFYTRLGWCLERQRQLIIEMVRRGYVPKFDTTTLETVPEWSNTWDPTPEAMELNRARIAERLQKNSNL